MHDRSASRGDLSVQALGYADEEAGFDEALVPQEGFLDALQRRMGAAPWWIISGAFHALLILLVTLIGLAILRTSSEDMVIPADVPGVGGSG